MVNSNYHNQSSYPWVYKASAQQCFYIDFNLFEILIYAVCSVIFKEGYTWKVVLFVTVAGILTSWVEVIIHVRW